MRTGPPWRAPILDPDGSDRVHTSPPPASSARRWPAWLPVWIVAWAPVWALALSVGCGGDPGAGGGATSPRPAGPPNVVLIVADDLDFDEIGVAGYADSDRYPSFTGHLARKDTTGEVSPYWGYGDARMHTPNLDTLAQDGALFERFYITSPVCNPARFSLLTGRQATRSSELLAEQPAGGPVMLGSNASLGPGDFTLARALGAAGYATGMVGKWDLTPRDAPDCGVVEGVDPDADAHDPAVVAVLDAAYERSRGSVRERGGFDSAERVYAFHKEGFGLPRELQVHNLEWVTEGALEFIEAHRQEPFFLYVAPTVPHGWLDTRIVDEDPRATPRGWLEQAPGGMPSRAELAARIEGLGLDKRTTMATWLDDSLGAILGRLDALGLADDTIVMVTSDHQNRGKSTLYEGARVPLVVRWPGRVRPGTRVPEVCGSIDVVPTLLEACGASAPADVPLDGTSFLRLMDARLVGWLAEDWREALLLQMHHARGVVNRRFKYIAVRFPPDIEAAIAADVEAHGPEAREAYGWDGVVSRNAQGDPVVVSAADDIFPGFFDRDQLYDLGADPYEQRNLVGVGRFEEALRELRGLLAEALAPLPHTFGAGKGP